MDGVASGKCTKCGTPWWTTSTVFTEIQCSCGQTVTARYVMPETLFAKIKRIFGAEKPTVEIRNP